MWGCVWVCVICIHLFAFSLDGHRKFFELWSVYSAQFIKKVNDDQIFIFYNRRTPYICILWSAHSAQFMGRIHDGQTSVKVRSPPKNIGGYGTVSVWRSAHFYRQDRDRLQSLIWIVEGRPFVRCTSLYIGMRAFILSKFLNHINIFQTYCC